MRSSRGYISDLLNAPVGSDRGALPGLLPVGFPGPPAAPAVRVSAQRALRVSRPLVSRWLLRGGCRCRVPRGRYGAAAVAVAGHRDAGRAGEHDPVPGEPPPLVAEATAELWHPDPVASLLVLGAYPAHDPVPCMSVNVAEGGLGHSVPEVVRP